jgi:hypothetical protein
VLLIVISDHWTNYTPFWQKLIFIGLSPLFICNTFLSVFKDRALKEKEVKKEVQEWIAQCLECEIGFVTETDAINTLLYITLTTEAPTFSVTESVDRLVQENILELHKVENNIKYYKCTQKFVD